METRALKKTISVVLFSVFFGLISNGVSAKDSSYKKLWWKNKEVVKELGLTDSQVEKIDSIFYSYKGELKSYRELINKKQSQLKNLIKDPDSTRQQVLQITDEINELESERHKLKVQMLWEIRDVLTPDQRIKLRKLKQGYMKNKPRKSLYLVDDYLFINNSYY